MRFIEYIRAVCIAFLRSIFPEPPHSERMTALGTDAVLKHRTQEMRNGHISLLPYQHPSVKHLIRAVKYEKHAESITLAANMLCDCLLGEYHEMESLEKNGYLLCTVPITAARKEKEGYNHMYAVLDAIYRDASSDLFSLSDITDARDMLVWTRAVVRQSGLKRRTDRMKNVTGAMRASHPVPDNTVCFVIDDVTTTGATLSEARRALTAAGASAVITIALAR